MVNQALKNLEHQAPKGAFCAFTSLQKLQPESSIHDLRIRNFMMLRNARVKTANPQFNYNENANDFSRLKDRAFSNGAGFR